MSDPSKGSAKIPAIRNKSNDLVEDIFIPGEAHLIGGCSGSGKTAFEVWMEKTILDGEPFLGKVTNLPSWWGVFIADRSAQARLDFWRAAGMEALPYYCLTEDLGLSPRTLFAHADGEKWEDFAILEKGIAKLKPPKGGVLTIDVANFFVGDFRQGYAKSFAKGWGLNRLAADLGITILCLMHGGKPKKLDGYLRMVDRIIGSSGFLGAIGTKSFLATPEETEGGQPGQQDFCWQSHHAPTEHFRLGRTAEGLFELVEAFTPQTGGGDMAVKTQERWQTYLDWMPPQGASNYLPTMEIMNRVLIPPFNYSKRTAERDLAAMEEKGLIVRFKGAKGKWQAAQRPKGEEVQ